MGHRLGLCWLSHMRTVGRAAAGLSAKAGYSKIMERGSELLKKTDAISHGDGILLDDTLDLVC